MEDPKEMFFQHGWLAAGTEPVFLASSSSSHMVPGKANGGICWHSTLVEKLLPAVLGSRHKSQELRLGSDLRICLNRQAGGLGLTCLCSKHFPPLRSLLSVFPESGMLWKCPGTLRAGCTSHPHGSSAQFCSHHQSRSKSHTVKLLS